MKTGGWIAVAVVAGAVAIGVSAQKQEASPTPETPTVTTNPSTAAFLAAEKKNHIPVDGGVYEIGVDINAGRWRTAGASDPDIPLCYYSTTPTPDGGSNIDQQGVTEGGPAIVDLPAGQFFHTSGCLEWAHD